MSEPLKISYKQTVRIIVDNYSFPRLNRPVYLKIGNRAISYQETKETSSKTAGLRFMAVIEHVMRILTHRHS